MKKSTRALIFALVFIGCNSVPITGRKQLNLLPESQMIGMSLTSYNEFLSANPAVPANDSRAKMVNSLGMKMADAVSDYCNNNGLADRIEGFQWEFKLVDDPTVNAWCMPGGKVVVYTGILDVAGSEEGLAVVMGHEIAHAVARHGNERMSTTLLAQVGLSSLDVLAQKPTLANELMLQAAGVGTQLGTLKFSRNHETEADKMGLIFMAMAGYDPHEAPNFWERMAAASGGQAPPEFLSTHPSSQNRVTELNNFMPEALKYYNK